MKREAIERQLEQEEEYREWCRIAVSSYTEDTMVVGHEPTLEGFLLQHGEFDHDELIDTIESEMVRIKAICVKEKEELSA